MGNNIIDLAVAYWRLEKWVRNAPVEKKMPANSSLRAMKQYLDANGIEVRDLTGQTYDIGMNLKVVHSDMPEGAPTDKALITDMIKPLILQNGTVILPGEVVIGPQMKPSEPSNTGIESSGSSRDVSPAPENNNLSSAEKGPSFNGFMKKWGPMIISASCLAILITFGTIFSVNLAHMSQSLSKFEEKIVRDETYTVCFAYEDSGDIISKQNYSFGEKIIIPETITNRPATETYTFALNGWNEEPHFAYKDMVYLASYSKTYIDYVITFVDYDDTVISTGTYHYGDAIEVPNNPVRAADNTYTYSFKEWDKDVNTTCVGNATYKAVYDNAFIDYTVTFLNYDDSVLSTQTYHFGEKISIPSNPTKPSDETYNYNFAGWDHDVPNTCEGSDTFKAVFSQEYIEYTISFLNYDDSLISEENYHFGDAIVIPANPAKPSDNTYNYSFASWDHEVPTTCSKSDTFKAVFSEEYIEYTIVFQNYDGSIISEATYHFEDDIVIPENPVKPSDAEYDYVFDGWDPEVSLKCLKNETYVAQFNQVAKS